MVKSAYYSQLPTIRCRDCGAVIDFAQEHNCNAPPLPSGKGAGAGQRRQHDPYPPNPYQEAYEDPYSAMGGNTEASYANGYGDPYGRSQRGDEYADPYGRAPDRRPDERERSRSRRDRERDPERERERDRRREKSRHRDPSSSARSRSGRDSRRDREKSKARGEKERSRPREDVSRDKSFRSNGGDPYDTPTSPGGYSTVGSASGSAIDAVMADLMNEISVSDDALDGRTQRNADPGWAQPPPEGQPRMPRPSCSGCGRKVTDPSQAFEIPALNGIFHIACFRCCTCGCYFDESNPYIPFEGRAYCEPDYVEALQLVCAGCNKPIYTRPVYALGQAWHENHLRCYACRQPIQGNPFEHDNKVYCAADYESLVAPKCHECHEPIQGETICALDNTFHRDCFVCKSCKAPFPDKSFYVFGNDPFCRLCYHTENNSICGSCEEPIEGPCAEVLELNKRYHPECWCCCVCRMPLTSTYYSFGQKPYCEMDILTVYRQEKANKRQTLMRNL
ncbi:hypothetical protein HDU85_005456 [Gaertneriomyces sp. JEL0708]|nr:hypothetical protein HDU85_005456 [Gaertneriomyces sp. JEL0708]